MLKLKIIVGSTREGRFSEQTLPWLNEAIAAHPDFEAEVLDLRDYELPFFDQPVGPSNIQKGTPHNDQVVQAWANKIDEADAFLLITPEYNRGYSAVLKNALDVIYHEWTNKPVGFLAYGTVGGSRAVEQLRNVVVELQMAPIRNSVHISSPWLLREADGQLKPGALNTYDQALANTLNNLALWGKALKSVRTE